MEQVQDVSIGKPRTVTWRGRTITTGIFKSPAAGPVAVSAEGLLGDGQADLENHGGADKAVYAYDASNTAYWRDQLNRPDLAGGAFGENLTVSGWPEDRVHIGDLFRIGTATLQISQPRQPCFKLGLLFDDPGFPKRFLGSGRVGYYLRVVESGEIAAGSAVERLELDPAELSVDECVKIWRTPRPSRVQLERVVAVQALASAWRTPWLEALHRIG